MKQMRGIFATPGVPGENVYQTHDCDIHDETDLFQIIVKGISSVTSVPVSSLASIGIERVMPSVSDQGSVCERGGGCSFS